MEKNKPVEKFQLGSVSASVWKNTNKNKEGKSFDSYSVTLQRVYTDKDGKAANTGSLQRDDLWKAINVLQCAQKYFNEELAEVKRGSQ